MTANPSIVKLRHRFYAGVILVLAVYATLLSASFTSAYAAEAELTDLFNTDAFTGSWEVFSKFNWLGGIMNFIISAFCLLGLFLIVYQRMLTMLYLSARSLFDRVHEIKQAGKGQRFLGLPAIFQNTFITANNGTGLDAFVSFFLSLLPDVKEYSDYKEENRSYNLEDTDTITTYILKVSLPTVMLIFFFTIGFSGTLFKVYGNVVEGMATVADNFVDTKLSSYIDRLINKGSAYKFAYGDDGSNIGRLRQRIAESIYSNVIKNVTDPNTDASLLIGQQVDQVVEQYFTPENISAALGTVAADSDVQKWDGSESTANNVQFSVVVNGREELYSGEVAWDGVNSLSSLGAGFPMSGNYADGSGYVHVVFNKKSNSVEHNYFEINDGTHSGGNSDADLQRPEAE